MKKLLSNGNTLILSQPKFVKHDLHDAYPTHASDFGDIGESECASGNYIQRVYFGLKDSGPFNYPITKPMTRDAAEAWETAINAWSANGSPTGAIGEWFNYVGRPMVYGKFTDAQWTAYVASV